MALRLRRTVTLTYPILHRSFHPLKPFSPVSSHLILLTISNPSPTTVTRSPTQLTRQFTSTSALFRKTFDPETDEIGPGTVLFEGCDFNHWLITMDFPKDSSLTREQKIETYVNTAAQVFGSVEEAKKNIYALSTTTYEGFQVLCSEDTSEKFKNLPGVVFVLPDSYIDPVNKEYGGDKYVNGEIYPRPPPVHYGRPDNNFRSRRDNYGPPQQQNYRSPQQQQNYGPPQQQQNYGPPQQQQNYGPPQQKQNYGPPQQQQNYGPPQQQPNNGIPPPQQIHGPPQPRQQQNYESPLQQQNYGTPPQQLNYMPAPRKNYEPPPQTNYVSPQQQSYGNYLSSPPQQNYGPPGSRDQRSFTSPNDGSRVNLDQAESRNHYAEGQRDLQQGNFQSHVAAEQRGFSQGTAYRSSQGEMDKHQLDRRTFHPPGNN